MGFPQSLTMQVFLQNPTDRRIVGLMLTASGLFSVGLAVSLLWLRADIRARILEREGEVLSALVEFQMAQSETDPIENLLGGEVDVLHAVLAIAEVRGVLAVQTFDGLGFALESVPFDNEFRTLPPDVDERVRGGETIVRLIEREGAETLEEVYLPVSDAFGIVGVARLMLDGEAVAEQFAELDIQLWRQGWVLAGSFMLLGAVLTGFVLLRLRGTRAALAEKSRQLVASERELVMTAKTSALGAVTGHLIHDLRGRLGGLRGFICDPAVRCGQADEEEWAYAEASLEGIEKVVTDAVELIRTASEMSGETVPFAEVELLLRERYADAARAPEIDLEDLTDVTLAGRTASMVSLSLSNLIDNGLRAINGEGSVRVRGALRSQGVELTVSDTGPGLPPAIRQALFEPKEGASVRGAGIGLVLARQLATAGSCLLSLRSSGSEGTVFVLKVPVVTETALSPPHRTLTTAHE